MTRNTAQIIMLALDGDPSATVAEKISIQGIILGKKMVEQDDIPQVVTRHELARLANRSVKWVDLIARTTDVLEKVKVPGQTRSVGYTRDSVMRFLSALPRPGEKQHTA